MPLMNQAEYAEHRGVSRQAINKLVKAGKLELTADGKIDAEAADRVLAGGLDPGRQFAASLQGGGARASASDELDDEGDAPPAAAAPQSSDFSRVRTVREAALAGQAQLELQKMRGALLDRKEVEDAFSWLQQALTEGLAQRTELLAARIASMPAHESADPMMLARVIREEDAKILRRMADGFAEAASTSAGSAAA